VLVHNKPPDAGPPDPEVVVDEGTCALGVPCAIAFGAVVVGGSRTVTFAVAVGDATLAVSGTEGDAFTARVGDDGASIEATFAPATAGAHEGTLHVVLRQDGPGSGPLIALAGLGVASTDAGTTDGGTQDGGGT
jgi:hypothetical protein